MSGIYLHIPFCKQACSYCDFYFVTQQEQKQNFVDELIKEIASKADSHFTENPIETIYFGGGTPSLLSGNQIQSILEAIYKRFTLATNEITLEMNPDDVSTTYLSDLKAAGITRASMGVQSFDESLLKFMNRAHTKQEALTCLEALSESDINEFTIDLIYGNPNQSLVSLEQDLNILLGYSPPHVSAYSLTIEPKTRLGKQLELGRIIEPDDEIVSSHFDLVEGMLRSNGIQQYEVSNFAKPGFEAKHNSAYWNHKNYIGLGPGAHSFWWTVSKKSAQRWNNKADLKSYLHGDWTHNNELEELDLIVLAEERLMLGLRTIQGVNLKELVQSYNFSFNEKQLSYLHQKEKEGKLLLTEQSLKLTKNGLKIADSLLLDLITLV